MAAGDLPHSIESDSNGKPGLPPERFKDAKEVNQVCQLMIGADRKRAAMRSQIDGLVNGNPVYSLAELKTKGQGWRARVNYREAEGLIQAQQTPFYDLVCEVDPCIEVGIDYGKGQDQNDWQQTVAVEFTRIIFQEWPGFDFHIPMQQREMLVHGLGTHVRTSLTQWIPRTLRTGHVLFPDDASANFHEEGEYFMARDFLPAFALTALIRNEASAKALGWNPDACWKALALANKTNGSRQDIEKLQREIKQGDIGYSATRESGLWVNHMFVREFEGGKDDTGGVSHYIIAEKMEVGGYLFQKRNKFECFPLDLFPYDIGNGTLHSIRGLGARTKDFFELSNRIKNSMADQVLTGATIPLKQTVQSIDPDKLKLMRIGLFSLLPYGAEPVTGLQFPPLNNGPIALSRELQSTLASNNKTYLNEGVEPTDRMTGMEFAMRSQDATKLTKGTHNLYYRNLTQFYRKTLEIMCSPAARRGKDTSSKLAKLFYDRCKKAGVPDEALQNIEEVKCVRSVGMGSAAARLQALQLLMQFIYPATTEDRKINIERDITSHLVGHSMTDRYARSTKDVDTANYDDSVAVLENDAMEKGQEALVAQQNDHVRHARRHLSKGEEIVNNVQSGMPMDQAYAAIHQIGGHTAQHLSYLQNNPMRKAEFQALHKEWLALAGIADQMQQQLEAQQQATQDQPPPQQQLSEDAQVKLAKVQSDSQIKDKKLMLDEQRKQTKLQFDLASKDALTAHTIRRANAMDNSKRMAMVQ